MDIFGYFGNNFFIFKGRILLYKETNNSSILTLLRITSKKRGIKKSNRESY